MGIPFKKMHGSGNDFILIDNRQGLIPLDQAPGLARKLCRRHFGVGADGLILIEHSNKADFKWQFLNADGSFAEMCGNGGRCAARFAHILGICQEKLTFETLAGIIKAEVDGDEVKLQLTPPSQLTTDLKLDVEGREMIVHFINTGVPHAVIFTKELAKTEVSRLGRAIRNHEHFQPNGTNVNFVEVDHENAIRIRTYERGVEQETFACGTGAVASALVAHIKNGLKPPVKVTTSGGERLMVYFTPGQLDQVYLKGKAILVYSGNTEEI